MASNVQAVTAETIISRARDMIPVMKERARRAEELRRLPPETHQDFIDAGFYKVLQPARYGGYELDYGTQTELSYELARGCASSGWVASITTCHAWLLGMYPPEAQEAVWGDDGDTLVASSFGPTDYKVERATGGYRVTGRWKFSSGVDLCDWVLLGTPIPSDKGPPARVFSVAPLRDCKIEDTWFVSGLAGTGSNDVLARDLFIPDNHMVDTALLNGNPSPGSAINPCHIFRLPLFGVFSYNLVGVGIGAAQGAVDLLTDQLKVKSTATTRLKLANLQSVQLRLAKAAAAANAAHTVIAENCEEMNRLERAGVPGEAACMRWRRDSGFASLLACQAVDELFPLLGGQGLQSDNAVQRAWRDAHAVGQHIALTWDAAATNYGAHILGVPPATQG
jgi:3-hydroxy-9,10-secoandrosta-1,3,5(10)-triene-9,17-dione monooxygenase